jgi:hypothetical protein
MVSAVCILFAAASSPAVAQETTVSSVTIVAERPPVSVVWKQWPNPKQVWPYTPERAERLGVGGWALVDCLVAADGKLTECNAWAVSNKDFFFDQAANMLTSKQPFVLDVTAPGADQLVGNAVRFAIAFPVSDKPGSMPPLCFPKDDGSVPIISTPQYAAPLAPIRRC